MADKLFTADEIARIHLRIAREVPTIYGYAMYGWPITDTNIAIKAAQNLNGWYTPAHIAALKAVANRVPTVWGFDCVNLTKGILWGCTCDETKKYGGAVHGAHGVPDYNANNFFKLCLSQNSDFSKIEVGEGLWVEGHWGLYVGGGLAVECTGRWKNGVQVTAVHNIGKRSGYEGRYWTKHGKLPWVIYSGQTDNVEPEKIELGSRIIRINTQGTDVQELQQALIRLGYSLPKYGADGDAGLETITALKVFQEDNELEPDGEFGKLSLAALKAALAALDASPVAPANPMEKTYTIIIYDVPEAETAAMLKRWPTAEILRR